MKKYIVIICLLLLTGCWDRKELSDIGIIVGMAIDKDPETGEYIITSQYLRPAAESTQTPTPEQPFLVVSATGKTIAEVMRKANQTIDRESVFAHNKVIIISEELAREGLIPIIDTFQRGKQVRGHVWFSIAKDIEAKKLLQIKQEKISRVPANALSSLFQSSEYSATAVNLLTYYKEILCSGQNAVVGVLMREEIDYEPYERVKLSGAAAFKRDKLVGFLNKIETRGYNWITGGPTTIQGAMTLPSLLEEDKLVTVLLRDLKSEIKPTVDKSNQITFTINVEQKLSMTGQEATVKLEDRKEIFDYLNELQGEAEKKIEEEIKGVIDKAQKDFQSDIFGFGEMLNKRYPKVWNKVKENWSETFATVPYTVNVRVEIITSGLLQGPFKPKE